MDNNPNSLSNNNPTTNPSQTIQYKKYSERQKKGKKFQKQKN